MCMLIQLRYWKSSEGRHKWKEVDIMITKSDRSRPDVRATIDDLPAYTALRAQVSVMNIHNVGKPSQIIDFFTLEGGENLLYQDDLCFSKI